MDTRLPSHVTTTVSTGGARRFCQRREDRIFPAHPLSPIGDMERCSHVSRLIEGITRSRFDWVSHRRLRRKLRRMLQRYIVGRPSITDVPKALTRHRFLDTNDRGIHMQTTVETRTVAAIACPIGICPAEFDHTLPKAATQFESQVQKLKDTFKPYRLILGVDRIDFTKGLLHKLRAFAHVSTLFLREYGFAFYWITAPSTFFKSGKKS
jgi:hypothetical protein